MGFDADTRCYEIRVETQGHRFGQADTVDVLFDEPHQDVVISGKAVMCGYAASSLNIPVSVIVTVLATVAAEFLVSTAISYGFSAFQAVRPGNIFGINMFHVFFADKNGTGKKEWQGN